MSTIWDTCTHTQVMRMDTVGHCTPRTVVFTYGMSFDYSNGAALYVLSFFQRMRGAIELSCAVQDYLDVVGVDVDAMVVCKESMRFRTGQDEYYSMLPHMCVAWVEWLWFQSFPCTGGGGGNRMKIAGGNEI